MQPEAGGVRRVRVEPAHAGRRVDNFVSGVLGGVPRGRLYRMLRRGEVRVDGRRVAPDYRLAAGEVVRIPPFSRAGPSAARPSEELAARLSGAVLYEDDDLLVLDKPAGLAVHGGSGVAMGLIEALRAQRPDCPDLALVHRLDRETSGCLALAKDPRRLRDLHAALRAGTVGKRYLALVAGHWPEHRGELASRLCRERAGGGHRPVRAAAQGKPARSRFRALERYRDATLVEVELDTGRTHQVRVQAAEAGHPVAGDTRYGDREVNRRMRAFGLRRLFLHAAMLRLPSGGADIVVHAPLPDDLREVLDRLPPRSRARGA